MVLMRLFQTSRRFHVEIQPQLVLLQKTLLNIEGLGRELDPDLDLWSTAKPFLEQWMMDQIGPKRLLRQLQTEAPRYAKLLPQLPRLMHELLEQKTQTSSADLLKQLILEQQRTHRLLLTMGWLGLGFVLGLAAPHLLDWFTGY